MRQCSALAMLRRAHAPSQLSSRVRARDAQRRDTTIIARASSSSMDVPSLASVADAYDIFLLDQFGVLHDGKNPYPGAIDAARSLASMGKSYIISNSSRESSGTIEKLTAMGFNAAWFAGAKTSGDCAKAFILAAAADAVSNGMSLPTSDVTLSCPVRDAIVRGVERRGKAKCAHVTWSARGAITLGDDVNAVIDVVDAASDDDIDFILIHGTEAFGRGDGADAIETSIDDIKAFVERSARRRVPVVVANPDFVTVSGDALVTMPGTLGKWYTDAFDFADVASSASSYVRLMGKPDAIIYDALLRDVEKTAGTSVDKTRVLAVGDSLEHDIVGASRAGIDALFIRDGIHAADVARHGAEGVVGAFLARNVEARVKFHTAKFQW